MTLKDRITADMKDAMRAKDAPRLSTIRMLLAAIKQRQQATWSSGDFAESLTYAPSRWRVGERLVIEFFRVTLPASLIAVTLYLYLLALSAVTHVTDLAATVFLAPLLALLTGCAQQVLALLLSTPQFQWR